MALTAVVSSCATYLSIMFGDDDQPLPSLVQGLSPTDSNGAFTDRLRATCPDGTPEAVLFDALERQGFQRQWPDKTSDRQSAAFFRPSPACATTIRVFWKPMEKSQIKDISGVYGLICL